MLWLPPSCSETPLSRPSEGSLPWFTAVPESFVEGSQYRVAPYYQLFGSEEMTSKAAVVAERIPAPYVAISVADAERIGVKDDATVIVRIVNSNLRLPVRVSSTLATGNLGLPVGLKGIPTFVGETWAQVMQEAV